MQTLLMYLCLQVVLELIKRKNDLYAAVYLDTLWNQMTFYQNFVQTEYLKHKFNSKRNITSLDLRIINKEISK